MAQTSTPTQAGSTMGWGFGVSLVTAIAPITWGSTYYVTQAYLPADRPLFSATVRALPIGLAMIAVTRRLPTGRWWWRALALGSLTIGGFFVLLFITAQRLPSGVASTLMATSPAVIMLLAWAMIGERPRTRGLIGAAVGFVGVGLLVLGDDLGLDPVGVLTSFAAMLLSSIGFVLTKRWRPPVSMITLAGWQLTAGGLTLLPFAWWLEGAPPPLDLRTVIAFGYFSAIATGLAYVVWLRGLQHLEAGTVALIGLLNPVTGALLGVLLAGEHFGPLQLLGMVAVLTGVMAGQPSLRSGWRRRGSGPPQARPGPPEGRPRGADA
ncbi:MAG: EamA family transporter [Kineosporiaceae bacterium]|nr:EamA family transporter [Kineosporiaceae bacterium]